MSISIDVADGELRGRGSGGDFVGRGETAVAFSEIDPDAVRGGGDDGEVGNAVVIEIGDGGGRPAGGECRYGPGSIKFTGSPAENHADHPIGVADQEVGDAVPVDIRGDHVLRGASSGEDRGGGDELGCVSLKRSADGEQGSEGKSGEPPAEPYGSHKGSLHGCPPVDFYDAGRKAPCQRISGSDPRTPHIGRAS